MSASPQKADISCTRHVRSVPIADMAGWLFLLQPPKGFNPVGGYQRQKIDQFGQVGAFNTAVTCSDVLEFDPKPASIKSRFVYVVHSNMAMRKLPLQFHACF